jgi:hypothetical protein
MKLIQAAAGVVAPAALAGLPHARYSGLGPLNEAGAQKSFQTMADSQQAMFEQRDKLSRPWGRR